MLEPEVSVKETTGVCISLPRRDTNKNLVWERGIDSELLGNQESDSSLLLTPILAQQLQEYNFIQFLSGSIFRRLVGIDRPAWTDFMQSHHLHLYSMTKAESAVLKLQTSFARNLFDRKDELNQPVLMSKYKLDAILRDLQGDDHPMAVEVYLNMSRGVEILPKEVAASILPTKVDNYKPATPLLVRQAKVEMQRHFDLKYVKTWAVLKAEYRAKGIDIGDPCNIHALGVVPKNEQVCRVTMDATNAGYSPEASSVNMLSPDRLCPYPVMKNFASSMSKFGLSFRADDQDAFLMHQLKPCQLRHACFTDPDSKEICAFVVLPLGFRWSAAIQQLTLVAHLRAYLRRLRSKGLTVSCADPVYEKAWPLHVPATNQHALTDALGYVDDVGVNCTSKASTWYAFITFIMLKFEWGIPQGFKFRKTDPPHHETLWIGYLFKHKEMTVGFEQERLDKLRAELEPYSDPLSVTQLRLEDARSMRGTLQFISNVIKLGQNFMSALHEIIQIEDSKVKQLHAAPKTEIFPGSELRHQAAMWSTLIRVLKVTSAYVGVRRKCFPFPSFGDASLNEAGWCWCCMGIVRAGNWPKSWLDKMGQHSQFKEIFITELELFVTLLIAREMFPRAAKMRFEGYCDNLGTVYMINKLLAKTKRCRAIMDEIVWLAVAFDVEVRFEHIESERNVLTDAGTRRQDGAFELQLAEYRKMFPAHVVQDHLSRYPTLPPARPEILAAMPTVHAEIFEQANVDEEELGIVLQEWRRQLPNNCVSNAERARAFIQENEIASL